MPAVRCSAVRPMRGAALLAVATMLLFPPGLAMAQETRTEIIRQEQADKLRTVTPPEPNRAEKIVNRLEDWGLLTGEPRGVYPLLDSVYPGGGFAAGLGARKPFGDDGAIGVVGAYSINSFWRAQTDVTLPSFASNRGRVSLTAGYLDAPDVKYYGIGRDSKKEDKTSFGYTPVEGGARLDFDRRPLFVRGRRGQVHRRHNRFRRHRAVDRGTVLTSRQRRASSSTSSSTSTAPRGRSSIGGGNSATRGAAVCTGSSSMTSASGTTIGTPSARSRPR